MKYSFIVAVRDDEPGIRRTLKALSAMDYKPPNFEVIVVDDASVDRTYLAALETSLPNWTVLRSTTPLGRGAARNLAVQHSTGEWLVIQDSDDVSMPQRLKWIDEMMEQDAKVDLIAGQMAYLGSCSAKQGRPSEQLAQTQSDAKSLIRAGHMPLAHGAVCIRRTAFEDVGGYRDFARAQDFDLLIRLANRPWAIDSRVYFHYSRRWLTPFRTWQESQKNVRKIARQHDLPTGKGRVSKCSWLYSECKRLVRVIRNELRCNLKLQS